MCPCPLVPLVRLFQEDFSPSIILDSPLSVIRICTAHSFVSDRLYQCDPPTGPPHPIPQHIFRRFPACKHSHPTCTHDNMQPIHVHTCICLYLYTTRCTHMHRARTCNTPTHVTAHSHVFHHTSWCMPTITCYLCGVSTHVVQHTHTWTQGPGSPCHPPTLMHWLKHSLTLAAGVLTSLLVTSFMFTCPPHSPNPTGD